MPDDLPFEKAIFARRAAADIVNDQVSFGACVIHVRNDADVRHSLAVQIPRDDVAR